MAARRKRSGKRHDLERALGRIVLAVAASAPAAGLTALAPLPGCRAGGDAPGPGGGPLDATVADGSASDGGAPDAGDEDVFDPCAPIEIDGAAIDDGGCAVFDRLPCGFPPDAALHGCVPELATCLALCSTPLVFHCQIAPTLCDFDAGVMLPDAGDAMILECATCPSGAGRRPAGLLPPRLVGRAARPLARYFTRLAHLEAASVVAFEELHAWLVDVSAPAALRRGALRAARDERRHTRAALRLARASHAPRVRRARRSSARSFEERLLENAVEGCVGETFGALLARWQSVHAADAKVRRAMSPIARDEARHADLAWTLLAWGLPKLTPAARERVRRRLLEAASALARRSPEPLDARAALAVGHPPPRIERALARSLARLAARTLAERCPA